ncbi:sodium ABC transporter ATP-binding protein, partial [Klebsiella oxytoca]
SVKKLEKKYPDFMVRDLSFFVEEHSITGFLGINGSGKTTTLKMLLGLVKPDMGEITILGQKQDGMARHNVNKHIGVVLDKS